MISCLITFGIIQIISCGSRKDGSRGPAPKRSPSPAQNARLDCKFMGQTRVWRATRTVNGQRGLARVGQPGPVARSGQRGSASSAARNRFDLAPARPPSVMLRAASPGASPDAVGAAGTPAGGAALPTECRDSDASREREAIASHSDASVSRETDASARPWPGPAWAGSREARPGPSDPGDSDDSERAREPDRENAGLSGRAPR